MKASPSSTSASAATPVALCSNLSVTNVVLSDHLLQISVLNKAVESAFITGSLLSWTANSKSPHMFVAREEIVGQPMPFFLWSGISLHGQAPESGVLINDDGRFQQWNTGGYPDYAITRFSGSQAVTVLQVTFATISSKLEAGFTKDDFSQSQLLFKVVGKSCRLQLSQSQVISNGAVLSNTTSPGNTSVSSLSITGFNIGALAYIASADNNIYVRDQAGTIQGVTTGGQVHSRPSWSHDGASIVYVKDDPFTDQNGNTVYEPNVYITASKKPFEYSSDRLFLRLTWVNVAQLFII